MKLLNTPHWLRAGMTALAMAVSINASWATVHVVSSFDTSASTNNWTYQNWNGSIGTIGWSTNNNAGGGSGSLATTTTYTSGSAQNGGAYRLPVNDFNGTGYTALEYDVKIDPASGLDQYGAACDFKLGVFTTGGYNYHANDLNIYPVSTNGGWQHVVLPASSLGGSEWGDIKEVFFQQYDNNYTNSATNIVYVDNIKFTGPNATYSNYVAFTFDDATFVNQAFTNWYGQAVTALWATNDSSNSITSGSMEVLASFSTGVNDNSDVIGLWFGTNGIFPPDSVAINGTHYASIDFDMMWDTNLSTLSISAFNSVGDIGNFPLGIVSPGGNQLEACGGSTVPVPDAASNGWVHMSIPLNDATPGLADCGGIWLKKYNPGVINGTAAYFIDNVVFVGGPIAIAQPKLSISSPVRGLQLVNNAGGPFDRESLGTFFGNFGFVDQPDTTYSMTIADFPSTNYPAYDARIYLDPNTLQTSAGLDYTDPNIIMIDIGRNRDNTGYTVIRCKTNSPNGNGNLYDAGMPTFQASKVLGKWSYTFQNNTNVHVVAPDGTSTNLPMPLGLTSSDMETYFSGGMIALFGGYNNGTPNIGQRTVLSAASIKQGSTTLLEDDFTTDTNLDINNGGGSSGKWIYFSGGNGPTFIYLQSPDTKYFIDWTVPADNFFLQTNGNLGNPAAWSTNTGTTATQLGDHWHTEIMSSNLPPAGGLFFNLVHPGLTP